MDYRKFGNRYVLRLDRGEEIVGTLKKFCEDERIELGWIKGIGAVNRATIGLFDTKNRQYHSIELEGDHEITSLAGNISTLGGRVYLHLHVNLSDDDFRVRGGHLNSAVISGTGEIVIEAMSGNVDRVFNEEIGLNLYRF
ncbi:MAG: DNA-binding protein [Firmicutes bacterium]|nr:DNA-binding protein [Bacillota bacterium]